MLYKNNVEEENLARRANNIKNNNELRICERGGAEIKNGGKAECPEGLSARCRLSPNRETHRVPSKIKIKF